MVSAIRSTGHAGELRDVQWLRPFEASLGKHLQLGLNAIGPVKAADHNKDHAREAF
jgi:hypothetical protein